MRLKFILIVLLFLPSVYAFNPNATLNDYPEFLLKGSNADVYFDADFVISSSGDYAESTAATYLIKNLQTDYSFEFEIVDPVTGSVIRNKARIPEKYFLKSILKDIQIEDIYKINAVVLGTPCSNKWIESILGVSKKDCGSYFKKNEGILKLIITGYHTTFLISGDTGSTVFEITRYFHEQMMNPLRKKKMDLEDKKEIRINLNDLVISKSRFLGDFRNETRTSILNQTRFERQQFVKEMVEEQKLSKELKSKETEVLSAIRKIRIALFKGS